MNVAQELGDADLYNYDVLVKLLSDRFDPTSRVSAFRSRFHGRSRRHHEDADTFADALAELCRVGYPQSPVELRQELIAEQFVRGQSDPELKKYLWVVIRTQKDKKLQTLIAQISPDFSSQDDCDSEEMFAVGDRPPWTNRRPPETSGVPTLQQMFALAQRMGYEMRPISRQTDAPRQQPGSRSPVGQDRGFRSQPRTGRDYSGASVVASLDTCSHVVPNRTRPCRLNQLVGSSSLKETDRETEEIRRKTHPRPGPHPPWSTRASFDPQSSFSH